LSILKQNFQKWFILIKKMDGFQRKTIKRLLKKTKITFANVVLGVEVFIL